VAVSSYRYQSRRSDEGLRLRLVELAREKPRFGYRRLHVLRRRSGEDVNHKRVHRVYREAGLSIRRKKRKHCVRTGQPLRVCTAANQEWALDYTVEQANGSDVVLSRVRNLGPGQPEPLRSQLFRDPEKTTAISSRLVESSLEASAPLW
jgi:transposase InsO family protein